MAGATSFSASDLQAIQRAGRLVATVEGMWCASCALAVERRIARLPGVLLVNTSFSGGSALVQWDPEHFNLDDMLGRVERLGYRLVPMMEADDVEEQIDIQTKAVFLRLAVAIFFGMWSMLGTVALYTDTNLAAAPEGWWVALGSSLAALPVVTYAALPFYRAGWRTLRAGVPGMDALISLGVLASFGLSLWQLWRGSSDVYTDTATMLVGFLLCGRLIELHARRQNSAAVSALRQAVPETARRLAEDGSMSELAVADVVPGHQVLVYAGERVPVDGVVIAGESELDRSLITGESAPVAVQRGTAVEAGCVNLSREITVKVERCHGQRFIDRIGIRMLELIGAKSSSARQAEQFARVLVPVAIGLSMLVFVITYVASGDVSQASLRALSVLVAACPCAVGLALPLAYAAATASAARRGILFRDPASMEALAYMREIMFDKTGTLTTGTMEVVDVLPSTGVSADSVLRYAASAEESISHPVARAILRARDALETGPTSGAGGDMRRYGRGVVWTSKNGDETVIVGTADMLANHGIRGGKAEASDNISAGATRIEVARNGEWIGALFLKDSLRPDAPAAIAQLDAAGLKTRLVTGDAREVADHVAGQLGSPATSIHANCRPEDKLEVVQSGIKPTVFVGDGLNDSLALAAADAGIAVRGASTAAVATAGVVITEGGLRSVVAAWQHSRRTFRIVSQNLAFSMVYNAGILGLAAFGMVPPVAATGAMLASSLTVVLNTARLRHFRT